MRLYLMRHGQASNMADTDHERPLTQKGRSRSESTARILANLEITPDVIFASPRVRAQETAQIISEAINVPVTTSDLVNFSFDIWGLLFATVPDASNNDLLSNLEIMFLFESGLCDCSLEKHA